MVCATFRKDKMVCMYFSSMKIVGATGLDGLWA